MPKIIDHRLRDGSRIFFRQTRPETLLQSDLIYFEYFLKNVLKYKFTAPVTDGFSEAYLDFSALDFHFQIHFTNASWEVMVLNAECPEKILHEIADKMADMLEPMRQPAREKGVMPPEMNYRVITSEDGKITCFDFATIEKARQYAADARWETENGPVTATIFDRNFDKVA